MHAEEREITVLNMERLSESSGGDAELMGELIQLYVRDTEEKLPGLEQSVKAGEAIHAGNVAHGIKGASAAVGAEEAAAAFLALERLGRSGETIGLQEALEEARAAFHRAREHLGRLAA